MRTFIFVVFLAFSGQVCACRCTNSRFIEDAYEKFKNILVVRILSYETKINTDGEKCLKITHHPDRSVSSGWALCHEEHISSNTEVIEVIKGKVNGQITVISEPSNTDCHLGMSVGDTLVVFLDDNLETSYNVCSVNKPLWQIDKKLLSKWRNKEE